MRLAIYGAGSLGTILGAYLAKAGIEVDLVSRNKAHIEALQTYGAKIVGKVSFTQPVQALLPEQMQGAYDVIFLMTKQLDNRAVATYLLPFLAEDGILCTMQNGLPEALLMEVLGPSRILGCTIGWGATLREPGVAELTSEPDSLGFSLGSPLSGQEAKLETIASILGKMGQVTIENNFIGARWSKLLINAAFSGMATVIGGTFGDVVDNPKARRLAQRIMKECLDSAKAAGIALEPVQGKDIAKLFDYHGPLKQKIAYTLIPIAMKKHRLIKPSMLQDIEAGKPCEIAAINGALSVEAKRVGVPAPINDQVVAIIQGMEDKAYSPGFANLDMFQA